MRRVTSLGDLAKGGNGVLEGMEALGEHLEVHCLVMALLCRCREQRLQAPGQAGRRWGLGLQCVEPLLRNY